MKRREFITLLGGTAATSIAWPSLSSRAQPQPKMLRVGFVGMQPRKSPFYAAFLERMAELGYQEGRNFTFEYIQAPNVDGYETSYRELAARKLDVFWRWETSQRCVRRSGAAEGGPIAFLAIDFDPLAKGYVANLSRPGGNVTGIFVQQLELAAKHVEIAREVFPRATVVGIAFDTVSREQRGCVGRGVSQVGPGAAHDRSERPAGLHGAFSVMEDVRRQPINLPAGPMFLRDREAIARFCSSGAFRRSLRSARTPRLAR